MKIAFCYPSFAPPAGGAQGRPLLSQNRQFQWYKGAFSYSVYPVVVASAATLMKKMGHEVFWWDYIAQPLRLRSGQGGSFAEFVREFSRIKPDLAVFETKTPVIKRHWEIINFLKKKFPKTQFVLMGDHVTATPEESLKNCLVDFVLVGGDYDFLLAELVKKILLRPCSGQAMKFQIPLRLRSGRASTKQQGLKLNSLPMIDRELTKWRFYAFNNGNFRYTPGAYTMIGRDCWWRRAGGCTFCSWTTIYPKWRVARPEKLLTEIEYLISLGVKEVFDDTGTFPVGNWLSEFCEGMIERGYNRKIKFGCNVRAGVLRQKDYNLMARAGFRFLLFGLESGNEATLEKLNKGYTVKEVVEAVTMAKRAGLTTHVTVMFGYPWESLNEARKTVFLCRDLFNKGVIDSLQATLVIPYPGTALFNECEKKGLLRTLDWERYDMRMPIIKCPIGDERLFELIRECYSSFKSGKFLIRKIGEIRSFEDLKYLGFLGGKYLGKMGDFK